MRAARTLGAQRSAAHLDVAQRQTPPQLREHGAHVGGGGELDCGWGWDERSSLHVERQHCRGEPAASGLAGNGVEWVEERLPRGPASIGKGARQLPREIVVGSADLA